MKKSAGAIVSLALAVSACSSEPADQAAKAEMSDNATAASPVTEVSARDADQLLSSEPALVVLDVRTPAEFAEGHIDGAINVDFNADDFAENLAKLDGSQRYLLHCKSGARSSGALEMMEEQGFESVLHMSDGFDAWQAAGHPVAQ